MKGINNEQNDVFSIQDKLYICFIPFIHTIMKKSSKEAKIEASFRKQAQEDKKVKNAYLLVHSDVLDIHLNMAEGKTGINQANIYQANHLASVGKLFTATVISILYERGQLDFNDKISKYLDAGLMDGLHVYKGKDYSGQITIRHLLMNTSGLNDVFYRFWKELEKNQGLHVTPSEAVSWGKKHLKPVAVPGKKHFYTDTNYYLLGLIAESITGKAFHEVMHEFVFEPLGMQHAYMYGFSKPEREAHFPPANLYLKGVNLLTVKGIHQIDFAGGSVIAPLEDFLKFMKALNNERLIRAETLNRMIEDDINMGFPYLGFNYGYSIWKIKKIPFIVPEKYKCWGCVGVTGAFMFYHPVTQSYIIGSFNDDAYRAKALQFMVKKVIKELLK
jgi:D-alanyl-D-alanine carboxypeptidase